ncbi:uncharacterized protein MELLADRAFT_84981 [Melampsora larici-populina 98AG31]|uniref:Uncharacterized protein n=1 Tax=Melampsora larici-populina (strain 98AG31 / pathotype 3-4-7) TaxID=747676 RepID=F4RGT5_MELLP|nr:uncharacterized protein MELLADRAFT_84981 [Melampsora larici-populina 98AG31]EGG08194.1 hypothetical protein MELLADRAFT_84981 [Melampsora larici-populina 98AG31]
MSFHLNGISHASFKIFSSLAESLLALIILHREYYTDFPFCPWKHGTEACKHIFGWMRVISPNFSVLDACLMMPKIIAVVKSIMSGRMKIPPSEHLHSGSQKILPLLSNVLLATDLDGLDDVEDVLRSTVDTVQAQLPDILTSISKDYEINYSCKFGEFPEDEAFEAAAMLTKEQNSLDVLLNQIPDTLESKMVQKSAMSISNLLNSSGMYCLA